MNEFLLLISGAFIGLIIEQSKQAINHRALWQMLILDIHRVHKKADAYIANRAANPKFSFDFSRLDTLISALIGTLSLNEREMEVLIEFQIAVNDFEYSLKSTGGKNTKFSNSKSYAEELLLDIEDKETKSKLALDVVKRKLKSKLIIKPGWVSLSMSRKNTNKSTN